MDKKTRNIIVVLVIGIGSLVAAIAFVAWMWSYIGEYIVFKKDSVNTERFIEVAKEEGFEVNDAIEDYADYDYVVEATRADESEGEMTVRFLQVDSKESAKASYEYIVEGLQTGSVSEGGYGKALNYAWCELHEHVNEQYYYLAYVEDTCLFIEGREEEREYIEGFVKKLGY